MFASRTSRSTAVSSLIFPSPTACQCPPALTELQASLCLTLSTLTLGLSLLIYGPLSDAIGRRPLMLVTMALATLCTLAIPLATDFSMLLALRALQGLFLGGLPAVALA